MATWKKVVVSGSSAELAGLTVDGTAIVGDLTGNVTGDLTGNVTGDVTGDVTGNVSGNAGTVTTNANLTGDVTSTGNATTLATVTVAKGGTGLTTIAAGSLIQAATADTITALTGVASDDGKVVTYDHATTAFVLSADAGGDVTADSTTTFTNKTIDVDATGNSISNLADANIKAGAAIAQSKINGLTTALAAKAPLASPAFTGTVTGVSATMVGLGNVDNTSDANKPVSTAQQTALDLKADAADPTFTGTMTAAALSVTGDAIIAGDLTVQGTASFESTENLLIKDRFIGLASGSAGASDGGIVVEQSNDGGGKGAVFAYDGLSTGRWGIDTAFNPTASAYTPAAFMSAVVEGGSGVNTPAAVGSDYVQKGNIFVGANQDIYIYS